MTKKGELLLFVKWPFFHYSKMWIEAELDLYAS
jgi:hypothetical protein